MKSVTFWMLIAAAVAATLAVAAVLRGQRRSTPDAKHALSGSVARRMSLFSTLAGRGGNADRPLRRYELPSNNSYAPADGRGVALV